jgi:hypothetical protein
MFRGEEVGAPATGVHEAVGGDGEATMAMLG